MVANTNLISSSRSRFAGWLGIVGIAFGFFACDRTSSDPKEATGSRGSLATKSQAHDIQVFTAWTKPVNLGPSINTKFNENHSAITRDNLSLYFTSTRPGGQGAEDIWVSHRNSVTDPWGTPQNVTNINSSANDAAPNITPDGHTMYFHSARAGGCGKADIYMSHRKDTHNDLGWGAPVNLGCAPHGPNFNNTFNNAPTFFEGDDGASLYFAVTNPPGGQGGGDIVLSTRSGDDESSFGAAVLVPEINSPQDEFRTAIRSDGLELFISSNRVGTLGGQDLWVATRRTTTSRWSTPVNMGPTLNTKANDGAPSISFDGTTLYFYSDRLGGFGGRDLYMSTRTVLHLEDPDEDNNEEAPDGDGDHN